MKYKNIEGSSSSSRKSSLPKSCIIGPSPNRFSQALNILGSHQFTHGRHYWEVEIAPFDLVECSNWIIGVSYSSVERNSWLGASEGTWILPCKGIIIT